jgi:hypothetical protein
MRVWWFQSLVSCAVGLELPFAKGEVKASSVQVPFKVVVVVQCVLPKASQCAGLGLYGVPQHSGLVARY